MMLPLRHPSVDELGEFLTTAGSSRARVATHLERCARCRESLQLLRVASRAAAEIPVAGPSPELRVRVLAARAAGSRTILPTHDATARSPHRLMSLVAAALVAVTAGVLLTPERTEVEAGTSAGVLVLNPPMPRPGQAVAVRYQPEPRLGRHEWINVRARLRTSDGTSYNGGMPTVTLGLLRRGADGTFTGSFTLPDSVVYAALAVEDSAASVVDDNTGRAWEILVAGPDGRPQFEALDQRAHDMMGRNWEEGFATARRMVALYPNDLRAWSWLRAFQGWLGRLEDDTVRALHRAKLAAFDSQLSRAARPTAEDIGQMAWYAESIDSVTARRWRTRLLHEAPRNSFAIQWRLIDVYHAMTTSKDTAELLRRLDELWAEAPSDRKEQVANYATGFAFDAGNPALIRRWAERTIAAARDSRAAARWMATRFTKLPPLRDEGVQRLRDELDALAALPPTERKLGETAAEQRERLATVRRSVLATLGGALVANGEYAAGLDTLALAAEAGWDIDVFRAVYDARLAAGDTAGAVEMAARLAADPRTSAATIDSARRLGERRLGSAGWHDRVRRARAEFRDRMLASASVRSLPEAVRVRDLEGRTQDLRALAKGRVTAVVFWSRFCGPAVEALPRVKTVAAHLTASGVRVVGIVEESAPSRGLESFLRDKDVNLPTYLDPWHEASRAFNQWGTPYYYVLDADGRIRFDVTSSADELLARAEALRLADGSRS